MNIEAIKHIRNTLDIGLSEAKQLLEDNGTVELAIKKWNDIQKELLKYEKNKKYIEFNQWFYIKDFFIECSLHFFNDKNTIPDKIKPLTKNYTNKLWNENISNKRSHAMMVQSDDDWNIKNIISFREEWNWCKSWDEDDYLAFEKNVRHKLDWNSTDLIYFFWDRYTATETNWETLYKYWIPFMYEDEMNIILNPTSKNVLIIGVQGRIAVGERNKI